jgi:hypothetical protein
MQDARCQQRKQVTSQLAQRENNLATISANKLTRRLQVYLFFTMMVQVSLERSHHLKIPSGHSFVGEFLMTGDRCPTMYLQSAL